LPKARQSIVPPRNFSQMRASDKTPAFLGQDRAQAVEILETPF
jgi:hypothetical protein